MEQNGMGRSSSELNVTQAVVKHRYRVIFGDTDQMHVVYYANYLRFFERGRVAFLRHAGFSYADFQNNGWPFHYYR